MKIYQIGTGGYLAGEKEIGDTEGAPKGWTRTAPPPLSTGEFAVFQGGAWEVTSLPYAPPPAVDTLPADKATLITKIDTDADTIYAKALGNRATEYAQAETDATAYKDAGYTGTVPAYVQAWATAKGKSATWATDDILTTSAGWRSAMAAIRFNRLGCKESARVAVDVTALDAVKTKWAGFVTAITAQLGAA